MPSQAMLTVWTEAADASSLAPSRLGVVEPSFSFCEQPSVRMAAVLYYYRPLGR